MESTSAVLIIGIILILAIGIISIVVFLFSNRYEFKLTLKQKDVEKEKAIQQTTFETQEAERKRIGEDLHDDIGPQLAFLKMQLSMLKKQSGDIHMESYTELADQLNTAIQQVRKVSHDLVPNVLYEFGLATAIKSISRQLNKMQGLSSKTTIDGKLPEMDKKKELAIYRIVQESVNNAIKHAQASRIDIHLAVRNGKVEATVSDDGLGIADSKKDIAGLGMKSMNERANSYDGTLHFESHQGEGTKVLLALPI